jgi:hypothetical protein
MAEKKPNRCWPGYEPVKGKPQHSQGSCRPKAESKRTPAEKEFRAQRKRQLDQWHKEHPKSRRSAAQHLRSPDAKKKASKKTAKKTTKTPAAKRKTAANRAQ